MMLKLENLSTFELKLLRKQMMMRYVQFGTYDKNKVAYGQYIDLCGSLLNKKTGENKYRA